MQDYFRVLGVSYKASTKEIKEQYRKLAKQYHPDVNASPESARKMQLLNEAYEVLSDPTRRHLYQLQLLQYYARRYQRVRVSQVSTWQDAQQVPHSRLGIALLVGLGLSLATAFLYNLFHPYYPPHISLAGLGLREFPRYLTLHPHVQVLNLQKNRFTEVPPQVLALEELAVLDFSENQLVYLPTHLEKWQNLRRLNLAYNRLSSLPHTFAYLPALQILDLRGNAFEQVPQVLYSMDHLRIIDLRGNPLTLSKVEKLRRALPKTEVRF